MKDSKTIFIKHGFTVKLLALIFSKDWLNTLVAKKCMDIPLFLNISMQFKILTLV